MSLELDICKKLEIEPGFRIAEDTYKYPGFTLEDLVAALIYTDDLDEAREILQGRSIDSLKKYLNILREFVDKGVSERWPSALLRLVGLKRCATCREVLPFSLFYLDKSRTDGYRKHCISCGKKYVENTKNERIAYAKQYYLDNKSAYIARCALRRARKLRATPSWSQLEEIKQFYIECPEGHEVDHIVPLQNDLVCGLHVRENLQYLSITENRQKSNKFIV